VTGQVLCSFLITPVNHDHNLRADQMFIDKLVNKKNYTIDLNILGMRNLESFGLFPVKKPIVKFLVRSLLPPEKASAI